jgi:TPR repeat protein
MYRIIVVGLLIAVQSASAMDFWAGSAHYLRGDYAAALREWRPLAEEGDDRAQYYLGIMYANGEGVPEDDPQAVYWFRKSARQGDARAQFNLGVMYEFGEGVSEDARQAVIWYQQAAEQGHAWAQLGLGLMFANGTGIPRDNVQAYAWFNLAAAGGDDLVQHLAKRRRAMLYEEITATQIVEARLLSGVIADRIDRATGIDRPQPASSSNPAPPDEGQVQIPIPSAAVAGRQQDTIRQSQLYLAALGYNPGPADGLISRRTRTAVQSFQRHAGLTPSGQITEELLWLLQAAVAEGQEGQAEESLPKPEATGSGSGFVINHAGEILTSHHAVKRCANAGATITFGDASHYATVQAQDTDNDLALLVVDSDESCAWWSPTCLAVFDRPASFSELPLASLGAEVAVAGYPLRGLLAPTLNVTRGNVSALTGLGNETKWLQISAPVQHGNSGGPVLDNAGNVIGVVTAKLNAVRIAQETGDVPQNVNFALKGAIVRSFLEIHGIEYSRQPSDEALTPEDLAALAHGFTVAVTCRE